MFNTIFGMLRDPVAGNQDAGILGTKPLKANVKKSWMQELLLASFMPGNIEFSTPNWQQETYCSVVRKIFLTR